MNWVQVHQHYKAKTAKTAGKRRVAEEKLERPHAPGRTTVRPLTTGRVPHHCQPMVATVLPGPYASQTMRFSFLWTLIWAAESSYIGPILQLPLLSSLIHMALNFTLSPITWLISHGSTIKTRKSRNKFNWRNRGVNHINIHLNPLK